MQIEKNRLRSDSINTHTKKIKHKFKNLLRLSWNNTENGLNARTTSLALPVRKLKSSLISFF